MKKFAIALWLAGMLMGCVTRHPIIMSETADERPDRAALAARGDDDQPQRLAWPGLLQMGLLPYAGVPAPHGGL